MKCQTPIPPVVCRTLRNPVSEPVQKHRKRSHKRFLKYLTHPPRKSKISHPPPPKNPKYLTHPPTENPKHLTHPLPGGPKYLTHRLPETHMFCFCFAFGKTLHERPGRADFRAPSGWVTWVVRVVWVGELLIISHPPPFCEICMFFKNALVAFLGLPPAW